MSYHLQTAPTACVTGLLATYLLLLSGAAVAQTPALLVRPDFIRVGEPTTITVELPGLSEFSEERAWVGIEGSYRIQVLPDSEIVDFPCVYGFIDYINLDSNGSWHGELELYPDGELTGEFEDSAICKLTVTAALDRPPGADVASADIVLLSNEPALEIYEPGALADGESYHQFNVKTTGFGLGFINVSLDTVRSPPLCQSVGAAGILIFGPPDPDANIFHKWDFFVAGRITKDQIPGDSIECTFVAAQNITNIARDTVTFYAVDAPATPQPDLIVESVRVSEDTLTRAQPFTFHATVRNQGEATSSLTTLRTHLVEGDSRVEVGTAPVSALLRNEATQVSVGIIGPSAAGTYYYSACVDSVRNESDANNNCSNSVAVTVGGAGQVPGAPTGLTLTAGAGALTGNWTAPANAGGSVITSYRVQWKSGVESWDSTTREASSTTTAHRITGLTNGTTYTVRVAAVNAQGTGAWSAEATGIPVMGGAGQVPGAPTGLTLTAGAGGAHRELDGAGERGGLGHNQLQGAVEVRRGELGLDHP